MTGVCETTEEVERGWAEGLSNEQHETLQLGPLCKPTLWFGIMQGNKQVATNRRLPTEPESCAEKENVDGVDRIAPDVKLRAKLLQHDDVQVALAFLHGRRYLGFKGVIAIDDPALPSELLDFIIHSLPFGAVGSVVGLNRVATALWRMMVKALFLHGVSYYDD